MNIIIAKVASVTLAKYAVIYATYAYELNSISFN